MLLMLLFICASLLLVCFSAAEGIPNGLWFEISAPLFYPPDWHRNTPLSFKLTAKTSTTPNPLVQYPFTQYPPDLYDGDSPVPAQYGSDQLLRSYGWYLGSLALPDTTNLYFSLTSPAVHCTVAASGNRSPFLLDPSPSTWSVKIVGYNSIMGGSQVETPADVALHRSLGIYLVSTEPPQHHDLWNGEIFAVTCQPQIQLYPLVVANAPASPSFTYTSGASYSTQIPITFLDGAYRTASASPKWKFFEIKHTSGQGLEIVVEFTPPAQITAPTFGWTALTHAPKDQWVVFDPLLHIQSPYSSADSPVGFINPTTDANQAEETNFASSNLISQMLFESGWDDMGLPCRTGSGTGNIVGHFMPTARTITESPVSGVTGIPSITRYGLLHTSQKCYYSYTVSAKWLYSIMVSTGQLSTIIDPARISQRLLRSKAGIYGVNYHQFPNPIIPVSDSDFYPNTVETAITVPLQATAVPLIEVEVHSRLHNEAPFITRQGSSAVPDQFRTTYTVNIYNLNLATNPIYVAYLDRQFTASTSDNAFLGNLFDPLLSDPNTFFGFDDTLNHRRLFACWPLDATDQFITAYSAPINRISLVAGGTLLKLQPSITGATTAVHWRCRFTFPTRFSDPTPADRTSILSFQSNPQYRFTTLENVEATLARADFYSFYMLSASERYISLDAMTTLPALTRTKLQKALNHAGWCEYQKPLPGNPENSPNGALYMYSAQTSAFPAITSTEIVDAPLTTYQYALKVVVPYQASWSYMRPTIRIYNTAFVAIGGLTATSGPSGTETPYNTLSNTQYSYQTYLDRVDPIFNPAANGEYILSKYRHDNGDYVDIPLFNFQSPTANPMTHGETVTLINIYIPLRHSGKFLPLVEDINAIRIALAPYHLLAMSRGNIPVRPLILSEITFGSVTEVSSRSWSLPQPRNGASWQAAGHFGRGTSGNNICPDGNPYCGTVGTTLSLGVAPAEYYTRSLPADLLDALHQNVREICRAYLPQGETHCQLSTDQSIKGNRLHLPPSQSYHVEDLSKLSTKSGFFLSTGQNLLGMRQGTSAALPDLFNDNLDMSKVFPTRVTAEAIRFTLDLSSTLASAKAEQIFSIFQQQLTQMFGIIPPPMITTNQRFSSCLGEYTTVGTDTLGLCGNSCSPTDCNALFNAQYARDKVHRHLREPKWAPFTGQVVAWALGTQTSLAAQGTLDHVDVLTEITNPTTTVKYYQVADRNHIQLASAQRPSTTKNFGIFNHYFTVAPVDGGFPEFYLQTFDDMAAFNSRAIKLTDSAQTLQTKVLSSINIGGNGLNPPLSSDLKYPTGCLFNPLNTVTPWCRSTLVTLDSCPLDRAFYNDVTDSQYPFFSQCSCRPNQFGPNCLATNSYSHIDTAANKFEYIASIPAWPFAPSTLDSLPQDFEAFLQYSLWRLHQVLGGLFKVPGTQQYPVDYRYWNVQPGPRWRGVGNTPTVLHPDILDDLNGLFVITRYSQPNLDAHLSDPYLPLTNFNAMVNPIPAPENWSGPIFRPVEFIRTNPSSLQFGTHTDIIQQLPLPATSFVLNPSLVSKIVTLDLPPPANYDAWATIKVSVNHATFSSASDSLPPPPVVILDNVVRDSVPFPSKFYIPTLHPNVIKQYRTLTDYKDAKNLVIVINLANYFITVESTVSTPSPNPGPVSTPLTVFLPPGADMVDYDCFDLASCPDGTDYNWIPPQLTVEYDFEAKTFKCTCFGDKKFLFQPPQIDGRVITMKAQWGEPGDTLPPFLQSIIKSLTYTFYAMTDSSGRGDVPFGNGMSIFNVLSANTALPNPANTQQTTVFTNILNIPFSLGQFTLNVPHTVSTLGSQTVSIYASPNTSDAKIIALFPAATFPSLQFAEFCESSPCPSCQLGLGFCVSATQSQCDKLQCPSLMTKSSDCTHCVCTTARCRKYTRVGMLYLQSEGTLSNLAVLRTVLPVKLMLQMDLNRFPAHTDLYTIPDGVVGIESVLATPIRPDQEDIYLLNAIAVYFTITPFYNTSPTDPQVQTRFDQLSAQWRFLFGPPPPFEVQSASLELSPYTPPGQSNPVEMGHPLLQLPLNQPPIAANCLRTGSDPAVWSTCLTIPSSPQWSTCPPVPASNPSSKHLTVSCTDYDGLRWYPTGSSGSPIAPWCKPGFALYPSTTTLDDVCPGSDGSIPQPIVPTLPSVSLTVTSPIQVGSVVSISWVYTGPAVNTVSVFLIGTTVMAAQQLSSDGDQTGFYDYTQADGGYLDSQSVDISLPPTALTATTTALYQDHQPSVFTPLQSSTPTVSAIFLATFPAALKSGSFLISNRLNTAAAARIQVRVTQRSTLVATTPPFALSRVDPCLSITCATNPNSPFQAKCNSFTSECDCPPGTTMPPNTPDSTTSLCQRTCEGQCQNEGECIGPNSSNQSLCKCLPQFDGEFCETRKVCSAIANCNAHGRITLDQNSQCTNLCHCDGNWDHAYTEEEPSGHVLILDKQCSLCGLPCDISGTNSTLTLSQGCVQCACKQGYTGSNCEVRSMYGAMIFEREVDIPYTPPATATASFLTMALFPFNTSIGPDITLDDEEKHSEALLFSTLQQSPPKPKTTILTLSSAVMDQVQQDTALSLDLDPSQVKVKTAVQVVTETPSSDTPPTTAKQRTVTTVSVMVTSATGSGSSGSPTPQTTSGGSVPIDDLYLQWANLQRNSQNLPVGTSPVTGEFGPVSSVPDAYDPNCIGGASAKCPIGTDPTILPVVDGDDDPTTPPIIPDPETPDRAKSSSTTIIIIVVVVVGVLIAVGVLAALLRYSSKNKIWCFGETDTEKRRARRNTNSQQSSRAQGSELSLATQSTDYVVADASQSGSSPGSATKSSKPDFGQPNAPVSNRKATIDLIQVHDDEASALPEGWSKWTHSATNETIYTNDDQMISQRHAPGTQSTKAGRWF